MAPVLRCIQLSLWCPPYARSTCRQGGHGHMRCMHHGAPCRAPCTAEPGLTQQRLPAVQGEGSRPDVTPNERLKAAERGSYLQPHRLQKLLHRLRVVITSSDKRQHLYQAGRNAGRPVEPCKRWDHMPCAPLQLVSSASPLPAPCRAPHQQDLARHAGATAALCRQRSKHDDLSHQRLAIAGGRCREGGQRACGSVSAPRDGAAAAAIARRWKQQRGEK